MNTACSRSLFTVIVMLWSSFTHCQLPVDHKNAVPPVAPQSGWWGSWGGWGECSLSCGGGVRERSRPCLPAFTPPGGTLSPRNPGQPHPHPAPGIGGASHQPPTSRSDQRTQEDVGRAPGQRRSKNSRISPGMFGYGKMPYVISSQNVPARAPVPTTRRSRSPEYPTQHGYRHSFRHNTLPATLQNARRGSNLQSTWAPLGQHQPGSGSSSSIGPGSGLQVQQEGGHRLPGTLASVPNQKQPYNPVPASSCPGDSSQYKMCNTNPCPPSSRNIRDVQCSSYNNRPFMGRLYQWEPFTDVPGEQLCELSCRAVGYRFYVRLSERVIDGTPCGQNDTTICVAGQCQSQGCDELLGSGKLVDKCGVCGGDNTACKLVSGIFQHSLSRVGYHKIVEIPEGATRINVTEMVKSQNYLALRSRSGRSIINGNWAIDRPGKYEGGGTMFTYRRPNEISSTAGESFLAEGPTNEILDVYMIYQQPNPGVHYEYVLPSEITASVPDEGNTVNTAYGRTSHDGHGHGQRPDGPIYPPHVPDNRVPPAQREYHWKLTSKTDCSASCGKGSRFSVFGCVRRVSHERVSDSLCDSATKPDHQEEPCNVQPCPAFWDIGEWSECSKTCGLGLQHRQVLCRQVYANRTLNVHVSRCRHLERPESSSTCQMKICSEWQIRSDWSPCSVPCGVGQRSREVLCVSNVGDVVEDDECNMKLRPSDVENCDMGPCAKSWFYTDWTDRCSAECGLGVRTRSLVCLNNHVGGLPLGGCGSERPPEAQACTSGPCESRTEWFTGEWSQCSVECGAGSQQRAVVCLMRSDEGHVLMPNYDCSSLDKPLSQQSCHVKTCGARWYHTDWSACSRSCEGGFRVREVRCLSDEMMPSDGCEHRRKPEEKEECNPQPCVPHVDENCKDKHFNCNVVVQARLCVYHYYKTACCASCSRVAQRETLPPHSRSYR